MKSLLRMSLFSRILIVAVALVASGISAHGEEPLKLYNLQTAIDQSGAQWAAGKNEISMLPIEDIKELCGTILDEEEFFGGEVEAYEAMEAYAELPSKFDWRAYNGSNKVTPIKRQRCGDCWAFAAIAALEARKNIDMNQSLDLSEQLLVSTCCSAGDCGGGYIGAASKFLTDTGAPNESCYPYKNGQNSQCAEACANWQNKTYKFSSYQKVNQTVDALKAAIYNRGPVNLGMMVYSDFSYYNGGVYKYVSGTKQGGHAVLAIGWDDGNQCFIVKNSWGVNWGEQGFFRIAYSEVDSPVGFGQSAYCYATDINHSEVKSDFTFTREDLTVSFKDASISNDAEIVSWSWDFGDGNVSSDQNPTHTYLAGGTYYVSLEVLNINGDSDSISKPVEVSEPGPPPGPMDYCESRGNSQNYEWIAKVTVGAFSNASGAQGYSDFTAKVIDMKKESDSQVVLSPGFASKAYRECWNVWIDFNQDGDFDDSGELVLRKSSSGAIRGAIRIPGAVASGNTRMRISMSYRRCQGACGSFRYGEVEDYSVRIQ